MKKILLLLAVCLPVLCQAFPATQSGGYEYQSQVGNTAGNWYSSPSGACSADASSYTAIKASQGYDVPHTGSVSGTGGSYSCRITNPYDSFSYGIPSRSTPVTYSCPANATLSGSQCSCVAPATEVNGACIAVDPVELLNKSGAPLVGEGSCSLTSCFQGHTVRGSGGTCWKDKPTGKNMFELYGPFTKTGASCSLTPAAGGGSPVAEPSTPSPADCPGYWGSVNGVDKCIPKAGRGTGTAENKDNSTTTSGPDGTTTTGEQKDTVCVESKCTTTGTKTTTNPDGTTTTTTTTSTQPQADYCSANPAAAACKSQDWCEKNPDTVGCSEFGTPDDSVKLTEKSSGFESITAVPFAAAGGCPAPLSFEVIGHQYAVSFQPVCNGAQDYIRPVVLVLAAFAAAFIFVNGFKV